MTLRIGLLSDTLSFEEILSTLKDETVDVVLNDFDPWKMDSILLLPSADEFRAARIVQSLEQEKAPDVYVPFIASIGGSPICGQSALCILQVTDLRSFLQITRSTKRAQKISQEAALRQFSLMNLGIKPSETPRRAESRNAKILYLGDPSALFLKIGHQLRSEGFSVTAALSELTAFEFLRENEPIAFVVSLRPSEWPHELIDHIRGRNDLRKMPVIALIDGEDPIRAIGVENSVFYIHSEQLAHVIEPLTSRLSLQQQVMSRLDIRHHIDALDVSTGAFSRTFAEAHFKNQFEDASGKTDAFSLAILTALDSETGLPLSSRRLALFRKRLESILRVEDLLVYLGDTRFAVSFSGHQKMEIEAILCRARRVLEATMASSNGASFSLNYKIRSVTKSSEISGILNYTPSAQGFRVAS